MADEEVKENENPEAEGEEGEEGEGEESGKVGGKKKLLLILIVVLLLGGGAAGAFFGGLIGGGAEEEHAEGSDEHGDGHGEDGHGEPAVTAVNYYELPPFLVNINSGTQRTSFLKMKVTLELEGGEETTAAVEAVKPRLLDAFNTYLRELRTSDLSGSAGIFRLRQELLTRTNKTLHPVVVKDILFSEIVVQ